MWPLWRVALLEYKALTIVLNRSHAAMLKKTGFHGTGPCVDFLSVTRSPHKFLGLGLPISLCAVSSPLSCSLSLLGGFLGCSLSFTFVDFLFDLPLRQLPNTLPGQLQIAFWGTCMSEGWSAGRLYTRPGGGLYTRGPWSFVHASPAKSIMSLPQAGN